VSLSEGALSGDTDFHQARPQLPLIAEFSMDHAILTRKAFQPPAWRLT
jgi:hypothetical protein